VILRRYRIPTQAVYFGAAPGDDLLCTTVLREIKRRGDSGRIWMLSEHPEIFAGNSDVTSVVPPDPYVRTLLSRLRRPLIVPAFSVHDIERDQDENPSQHIIAHMCAAAGLSGQIALRPYLYLTPQEYAEGEIVAGQIAIQSSARGARFHMMNKEWYPDRFQQLVDGLKGQHTFVQVGTKLDPPIAGAIDMRGKTTIRQTAAILARSRLFVGLVGFLMHLARSVETRSVIVFGGRESPWQSGYPCNINLTSTPSCSPCWRWNTCEFNRRCMSDISVETVAQAICGALSRSPEPLELDTVEIKP
jgi:hypothetical protein